MWISPQLYNRGLEEILCRIGQEAVWNWMLFLPSRHYPQALTKGPNLPAPLNLCFKMKDMSNGGSFLILLLLNGMERKEGIGEGKKRSFRTPFSLLLHHFRFLPALSSLLEERAKFMEKIPWGYTPNQLLHFSSTFWQGRREQKGEGRRKKNSEHKAEVQGTKREDSGDSCWRG